MKKRIFLTSLVFAFIAEITMLVIFAVQKTDDSQDAVIVNEVVWPVKNNWNKMENYKDSTGINYVVLDSDGMVLYRTKTGLSESINEAVIHKDTILDIENSGNITGKVIIYNNSAGKM